MSHESGDSFHLEPDYTGIPEGDARVQSPLKSAREEVRQRRRKIVGRLLAFPAGIFLGSSIYGALDVAALSNPNHLALLNPSIETVLVLASVVAGISLGVIGYTRLRRK